VNVLHLSQFDERGGAARAAYRLHDGLRRLGITSRMLVQEKTSSDPDVDVLPQSLAHRAVARAEYEIGIQYAYLPSGLAMRKHPWARDADVIHLGNVHGGLFSITSLPRLAAGRRVVWTLHDMWPFTGHCGYASCDRWLTGCGSCPDLPAYPPVKRDATHLNWRLKDRLYEQLDMTVVAPSRWLAGLAARSPLLGRFPVEVIPYGIDTTLFAPVPRAEARARLGLPPDEALVLVAGIEPRKGSELLGDAIAAAESAFGSTVTLLVAGVPEYAAPPAGAHVRLLGKLDERSMRDAYAAADVYLLPTLSENLPNTVLEALACGTAVVGTPVGGIPDVVVHGDTGLIAPADGAELGRAVGALLRDRALADRLGAAARELAVTRLGSEQQAAAYRDLYAAHL
jgi:glycosyltransferase involved in cell wall biosynthesis